MNYELAKQLKEAGFCQSGNGYWIGVDVSHGSAYNPEWSDVYTPTLSELVEACGRPIWMEGYNIAEVEWMAGRGKGMDTPLGRGKTPEEAVAMLWLALNKK